MSDVTIEGLVRQAMDVINTNDVDKILDLFAEDGLWRTPSGLFKGKAELRKFVTWITETMKDNNLAETGAGVMIKGRNAMVEHIQTGFIEGDPIRFLSMCAYEFDDNDKIRQLTTIYDRLAMAEQAADRWLEKTVVHSVVNKVQEGLTADPVIW